MRRPLLTSRLRSERKGGGSQPDGGENGRSSPSSPSVNLEAKRLREDFASARGGDVFARVRVCPMILVFAGGSCSPGPVLTRTIAQPLGATGTDRVPKSQAVGGSGARRARFAQVGGQGEIARTYRESTPVVAIEAVTSGAFPPLQSTLRHVLW